jgi:HD-like signal output (HDOD) protein
MPETTAIGLVHQFIQRTGQLYSLPAVAAEVLRLTAEPKVDARALKECIERDPALTTRILRVVNSSLFGASRQVTDLNQALSLLGNRPLKMLVLGFSLPKELFHGVEADVLSRYWRRTLIKAVAARELAEKIWKSADDEAFIAGLVQDIGVLALVQQIGDSYLKFLDHAQTHGGNILDRELETLGFDHLVLSSRLLSHWGLPASLCAAISIPPDEVRIAELEPAERTLPRILHLSEILARLIEQPYGPALRDLLDVGGRYCGLTYESLQPIVGRVQGKVAELAEVLALTLPEGRGYLELLVESRQRLADETAVVAAESLGPEDELLDLACQMRTEMNAFANKTVRIPRPAAARPLPPESHPSASHEGSSPASATVPMTSKSSSIRPVNASADPILSSRVSSAVQRCRQARCSISLALLAIDDYSNVLLQLGPSQATELTQWLRIALADWTGQRAPAMLVGESCFALVWEDCPRSDAVQFVRHALATAKEWWVERPGSRFELTISAGLATLEYPPRNFPPNQLIDAGERCLAGAQLSGGDSLKSILF